ncbi:unnamed protein product [Tetraodon nigroviridis]|uniref:(spotted green pufferfish) hypothetical protein n=1 Tax=Tetraodon nigroviridis TaxID=99883 RepID=Q4SAH9_TETNG|nr:unnamed protein product [Tetraodon nigroviridis]
MVENKLSGARRPSFLTVFLRPGDDEAGPHRNHVHKQSEKTTRVRTVLNEKQLHTLRTCYNANPRPDALMKEQLVEMTGLSPRVIRVWFQNKRCKDKKKAQLMKQLQQQQHSDKTNLQGLTGTPLVAGSPIRHESAVQGEPGGGPDLPASLEGPERVRPAERPGPARLPTTGVFLGVGVSWELFGQRRDFSVLPVTGHPQQYGPKPGGDVKQSLGIPPSLSARTFAA